MSHLQSSPMPAASVSPAERAVARPRVLRFEDVETSQTQFGTPLCRVTLAGQGDRLFVGEGTSVAGGTMKAAAQAAVRAVQAFADVPVTLESIKKTYLADRNLILVVVGIAGEPPQALAGAVLIRGDESKAATLAVLDATNRWLETRSRFTSPAPSPTH